MSLDMNFLNRVEAEVYACAEKEINKIVEKYDVIQLLRDEKRMGVSEEYLRELMYEYVFDKVDFSEIYDECLEDVCGKYTTKIFDVIKKDEELYNAVVTLIYNVYDIKVSETHPFDAYLVLKCSVAFPMGREVIRLSPTKGMQNTWWWKAEEDIKNSILKRV